MMRGWLLLSFVFLFAGVVASAETPDQLVVYPEYPEQIHRDFEYGVSVSQNAETKPLTVYDHTESSTLSGRAHGGDCHRRFCEFAFQGAPVRVDFAVRQDVRSFKVFPAALCLKNEFKDGVLSVWLDRPEYFGIQLNDDNNSIISVFADAPEDPASIPQKGAEGVLYVEKWLDAPEKDGRIVTDSSIHEIYVAPGAVLNARLTIKGENTLVHGRGMILDPLSNIFRFDQTKSTLGFLCTAAKNVTVRDVKLIDSRTFNYIWGSPNVHASNVKALASMMCSDGMSFWGGAGTVIDHAWLYVGDNALVLSGSQPLTIRNVAIGTSCAAIFPQSSFKTPVELENIYVFRCDEGLINNYYNGSETPAKNHQTIAIHFKNFTGVDSTLFPWIFQGRNMGTLPKTVTFENASFPESTGAALAASVGKKGAAFRFTNGERYLFTNNYHLDFTNLFIDGKKVTDLPEGSLLGPEFAEVKFHESETDFQLPLQADRKEVSYVYPFKVYAGHAQLKLQKQPRVENGKLFLPVKELKTRFGIESTACAWDQESGKIRLKEYPTGQNLVAEKYEIQSVWQRVPSWMAKVETIQDGETLVYVLSKVGNQSGMQSVITDGVLQNGNGKYVLEFEAQTDAETPVSLCAKLFSNEKAFTQNAELTSEWKAYHLEFDVDLDLEVTRLVSIFLQFPQGVESARFKNISLKKQ